MHISLWNRHGAFLSASHYLNQYHTELFSIFFHYFQWFRLTICAMGLVIGQDVENEVEKKRTATARKGKKARWSEGERERREDREGRRGRGREKFRSRKGAQTNFKTQKILRRRKSEEKTAWKTRNKAKEEKRKRQNFNKMKSMATTRKKSFKTFR